jgi:NADH:ubiquinone oxidoreductase subunit F (NADH-binding)/NADH:ubiquinone oxidoreductase subunit E
MLIDELRVIQREHGYLPVEALRVLAERAQIPLYQLHGVASFYPHFRLTPPPAVEVRVCADMTCHLRGGDDLRRSLQARLVERGPSGVVIHEVSCLGQCDRAPAASINDAIVARLTRDRLEALVDGAAAGGPPPPAEPSPLSSRLQIDPYEPGARYEALRALLASRDVAGLLTTLKSSELRGLGGAGFPTGVKWEIVRGTPGPEKYVVCNADESEPGTIKDRFLMEHVPHLVIEGMILAGVVTGARTGILYVRHEYEAQAAILKTEIDACRRQGLIGDDVLGSGMAFDLTIFLSPGGYICGEESALLEALEGKRAEPRNKPPFPGTHGLWQKPTLINNVETFAFVPLILRNGVEWFKRQGRAGAPGLKFVGVSGHVVRPGVYEVAMGTPAREVIFERAGGVLDGRALKAFAPSGPSSGYLPASMVDVPLDFKSLQQAGSMLGSGAIVVCAEGTCMLDMALNAVRFFRNESCGKCVPCRLGSAKMVGILEEIAHGRGRHQDLDLINELSEAMMLTSICGLGQVAPAPIKSVITHFPEEIEDHVVRRRCPAGVCPMA